MASYSCNACGRMVEGGTSCGCYSIPDSRSTHPTIERLTRERDEALDKLRHYELVMTQEDQQIVRDVQRLEAERDEARAEAHDATVLLIHRTRGRDEARAELEVAAQDRDYNLAARQRIEARHGQLVELLREVDRLLREDMGGWYVSAPHSDPLGIIREDIRAALEAPDAVE